MSNLRPNQSGYTTVVHNNFTCALYQCTPLCDTVSNTRCTFPLHCKCIPVENIFLRLFNMVNKPAKPLKIKAGQTAGPACQPGHYWSYSKMKQNRTILLTLTQSPPPCQRGHMNTFHKGIGYNLGQRIIPQPCTYTRTRTICPVEQFNRATGVLVHVNYKTLNY